MQDRIGANRASIFGIRVHGLLHPLADAIKMLTKEDFMPARADRLLFMLAPFVSVFFALAAFASIPFGDTLHRSWGATIQLQAVTLNVGILYVLGMLSLGVYGLMMAGWASANNYALLGGQRAAALMISAEIAIGASIMGVVMVYGSLNMQDIARGQGQPLLPQFFGSWIPAWGILTQPLAFVLFLTAGIAATKRIPFDMPGGRVRDHRLLRGVQRDEVRHVRHGRLPRDGGDRGHDHRAVPGRLAGPVSPGLGLRVPLGRGRWRCRTSSVVGLQVGAFLTKVVVMIWFLMLIRWTLPRFRYDQAMRLGWLGLFPLSHPQHRRHRPRAPGGGEGLSDGLPVPSATRPPMTRGTRAGWPSRQRFYVVEVLAGLALTAQHFFANMWRHTLHAVFRVKSARGRRHHPVPGRAPARTRRGCAPCTGWSAGRTARRAAWRA